VLDRIAGLAPLGRSLKCELYAGRLDGAPVVAKVLSHAVPVWRWYFEREVAVLPLLREAGAPALITADVDAGVMILERLRGEPLTRGRRVTGEVDGHVIDAALAISGRAAAVDLSTTAAPPPPGVRAAMRRRLLEDPSAPLGWFLEGIDRCGRLEILSRSAAAAMTRALDGAPVVCQHGDLMPRNILAGERVSVIDWECAGDHAADWDRALLWAGLGEGGRARIEASIGVEPGRTGRFRALCAFALAREVKFARAGSPNRSRREADLAAAAARLEASWL
jgi:aminoglycoside phosphotransferase (APT) family kinase protein